VLCPKCGVSVGDFVQLCPSCVQREAEIEEYEASGELGEDESVVLEDVGTDKRKYAGFILRFAAHAADTAIVGSVLLLLIWLFSALLEPVFAVWFQKTFEGRFASYAVARLIIPTVLSYLLYILIHSVLGLPYYILMESSSYQGTLGKILVGIKVVDLQDQRLTLGRGFARYFMRQVPTVFFILLLLISHLCGALNTLGTQIFFGGMIVCFLILSAHYLMMLYTEHKQALHDLGGGTYVVREVGHDAKFAAIVGVLGVFAMSLFFFFSHSLAERYIEKILVQSLRKELREQVAITENLPDEALTPVIQNKSFSFEFPTAMHDGIGELYLNLQTRALQSVTLKWFEQDGLLQAELYGNTQQNKSGGSLAELVLKFPPGTKTFRSADLKAYRIRLHASDANQARTWNSEFVPEGFIISGEAALGHPIDLAFQKGFSEGFALRLNLKGVVISDVPSLNSRPEALKQLPDGSLGLVQVGQSTSFLLDSVTLLSPEQSRLSIGFYERVLSPEEKALIVSRQSLNKAVGDTKPVAVLMLRFDEERAADVNRLGSVSVYLRRNPHGRLYFEGDSDVISFNEDLSAELAKIVREFSGELKKQGSIRLEVFAEKESKAGKIVFGVSGDFLLQ